MCLCKMVGKNNLKSLKKTLCRVYKKSTRQSDLNFAECHVTGTRKSDLNFAECHLSGTRQRRRHGPKHRHGYFSLPSARQKALGKDVFAGIFATECPLPSVTLGKAFAECFRSFAECPRHLAKVLNPVVHRRFEY
jgi:hypothetical protein